MEDEYEKYCDDLARAHASQRCRCWKCDGVVNATHTQCNKTKLETCLKWYNGYRTAKMAVRDCINDIQAGRLIVEINKNE